MSDSSETQFGLRRRPLSVRLGEELRLELDPRLQMSLRNWLLEGDLGRARNYALAPDWSGLEVVTQELLPPRLFFAGVGSPAPNPVFRSVVATARPLCPTVKPAEPPPPPPPPGKEPIPKPGDVGDVLKAVSKTDVYQCVVVRPIDELMRTTERDYRRLSTGERVTLITAAGLIGAGALAGVLSDAPARQLAFQQILGKELPVPGVAGFSFHLLAQPPAQGATDATRPVGIFFTLDVPAFLQNFQYLRPLKANF